MKIDYVEKFLLEKRAYMSYRIKIKVNYDQLKTATVKLEELQHYSFALKYLQVTFFSNHHMQYESLLCRINKLRTIIYMSMFVDYYEEMNRFFFLL
jgi:hypothetical protein